MEMVNPDDLAFGLRSASVDGEWLNLLIPFSKKLRCKYYEDHWVFSAPNYFSTENLPETIDKLADRGLNIRFNLTGIRPDHGYWPGSVTYRELRAVCSTPERFKATVFYKDDEILQFQPEERRELLRRSTTCGF